MIKPGDTVVDVGGNIGFFTLWVMDKIGASGHVYAFEPIPSTFDVLRENASLCVESVVDRPVHSVVVVVLVVLLVLRTPA